MEDPVGRASAVRWSRIPDLTALGFDLSLLKTRVERLETIENGELHLFKCTKVRGETKVITEMDCFAYYSYKHCQCLQFKPSFPEEEARHVGILGFILLYERELRELERSPGPLRGPLGELESILRDPVFHSFLDQAKVKGRIKSYTKRIEVLTQRWGQERIADRFIVSHLPFPRAEVLEIGQGLSGFMFLAEDAWGKWVRNIQGEDSLDDARIDCLELWGEDNEELEADGHLLAGSEKGEELIDLFELCLYRAAQDLGEDTVIAFPARRANQKPEAFESREIIQEAFPELCHTARNGNWAGVLPQKIAEWGYRKGDGCIWLGAHEGVDQEMLDTFTSLWTPHGARENPFTKAGVAFKAAMALK